MVPALGKSYVSARGLDVSGFDREDSTVFILGAGASAPAGIPMIRNFLDTSREFFDNPQSQLSEAELQYFNEVFEFRRRMAQAREKISIDLDDIEELFGLVEMTFRLGVTNSSTRDATVYLIAKTIQLAADAPRTRRRIGFILQSGLSSGVNLSHLGRPDSSSGQYTLDMYDYFATLLSGNLDDPNKRGSRTNTVVTFNYDLVIDDALRRMAVEPFYHLPHAEVEPMEAENRISVLHLHGSTNWGICAACEHVLVLRSKLTTSPAEFFGRTCSKCKAGTYKPFLVPPSWDKSDYRAVIQPIWSEAVARLSTASRIVIIGYSMPQSDVFFKYLLTVALSQNHRLYSITVIDYRPPITTIYAAADSEDATELALERRYRELLEPIFASRRFNFRDDGFEFYLSRYHPTKDFGRGEAAQSLNAY